jgi:site-specific DNA-methyltransferase (adenine-specific)
MVCAIEDAGFEIRDSLHWIYGTGFPKSLNVGGGRGTALKPAHEPIVLARKPLMGTVAKNMSAHGTGALNIDACRLGPRDRTDYGLAKSTRSQGVAYGAPSASADFDSSQGRWPANILLDEAAAAELDAMTGNVGGGTARLNSATNRTAISTRAHNARQPNQTDSVCSYGDSGGASRFFYCAKASRNERDKGCDSLPFQSGGEVTGGRAEGSAGLNSPRAGAGRTSGARNIHPTVKPVALMRWLVRLVTPVGGTVLDPFMGSGTTGIAAKAEDRNFIGIEMQADYLAIAEARIGAA